MKTIIHSNGSKWAGEIPDNIEKLIEVLGAYPLRREFEAYGDFFQRDPVNEAGKPISELLGIEAPMVSFFGNFHNLSHVFHISTNDPEVIAPLTAAIEANKKREDYRRQPPAFDRRKVGIERKRFSTTQGEVLLTYDGQRIDQFGDKIELTSHGWDGLPDRYWQDVAWKWLADRHAEQFEMEG